MKNWTPKEVVAFIRDAGFEDMRGLSLECLTTLETNTVVESTDDSPVEVTATRKKDKNLRITRGALQPGGEVFEAIHRAFFQFDCFTTISDVAKASGQTPARCGTVVKYLINQGKIRRNGRRLDLLA
jgi:hypothetical protein